MKEIEKVNIAPQRMEAYFVQRSEPTKVKLAEGDEGQVDPESEPDDRTWDMVWYTGATVLRSGWDGPFNLTLSMDPAHVRMDRLASGRAPVLNTHNDFDVNDVVGVVQSAALDDGVGKATVRFSNRPDVDGIWQDIQDGILRNASVGAKLYTLRDITEPDDKIQSFLAIDWEPQEISVVPVGADMAAQFAKHDGENECVIERATAQGEDTMVKETQSASPAVAASPDTDAIRTATLAEERNRVSKIRLALAAAKLSGDEQFSASLIDTGMSVDLAREKILEKLAEASDKNPTSSGVVVLADEADKRREGVENALLHRYDPKQFKLSSGREYAGLTLLEIAKDACLNAGKNPRTMPKAEMVKFAFQGTTDFPAILGNVANKTLRTAYEAEPQTFKPFTRQVTASDFKPLSRIQLGDTQTLELVGPSGEYKYGSLTDAKETYQLATYGKIIAINRQTIINDDLDAFTRIPASQGRAAARLESDIIWGIITSNPNMGDGNPLFSVQHNNLTSSGTAIAVNSLGVARKSLRTQMGLGNIGYLNLTAKYLLVPTVIETLAQQFVTATNVIVTKASDVNPFAGTLTVIAEPRLDTASLTTWYGVADPAQIDTIEYAYLSGQEGVYTETRMGFDVDGMEMKARLDFGAKAIDWRGMYKNVGA